MGTWISPLVSCVLLATAGLPATAAPADTPPNRRDRAAAAPAAEAMRSAAEALLAALDAGQRAKASFAFGDPERENFRFTPQTRRGLALKEMNEPQQGLAIGLPRAALSDRGALKAMQIIALESLLGELEKRPDYRDPGKYHVSIFGTPGDAKGWGWKFEGHHLSLNYTVVGGRVAVTPQFMGANPAEVRSGPLKGRRVLGAEEDLARTLAAALYTAGRTEVVFSTKAPAEILTGEQRRATALEPVGAKAADMSAAQRAALMQLVAEYAGRHRKDLADAATASMTDKAGIDRIRFGWAGSMQPGEAWYYRIQGPSFLIEAANTQNDANHIHTTWRDLNGDFGQDLLGGHYERHAADGGNH